MGRRPASSPGTRASSRGSSYALGGARPLPLSAGRLQHFAAAFYLRNPPLDGLPGDSLSIARRRFVGTGLQERIAVRNESMDRLEFELSLELGADFADIITVKQHDFALGDPEHAPPLPPRAQPTQEDGASGTLLFAEANGDARTRILLSKPARFANGRVVYPLALEPHESWELRLDVLPSLGALHGDTLPAVEQDRRRDRDDRRRRRGLDAARPEAPRRLGSPAPGLRPVHRRSRGAPDPDRRGAATAVRSRYAVVHDGLRP